MFDRTIKSEAIRRFKAHLHGDLLIPGDEGYESARKVWNGAIDKYPALIVRCSDVSDVASAVQFARAQELPVAVRGGGHSFSGNGTCDGGLVIDLSPMKRVQVDPVQRTAWAQAGLTLGEFARDSGVRAGNPRRQRLYNRPGWPHTRRGHWLAHGRIWPYD